MQTSLDDDDFFTPLSRKSPTAGQTAQAGSNGTTFPWPQAAVAQPAYDSEDDLLTSFHMRALSQLFQSTHHKMLQALKETQH